MSYTKEEFRDQLWLLGLSDQQPLFILVAEAYDHCFEGTTAEKAKSQLLDMVAEFISMHAEIMQYKQFITGLSMFISKGGGKSGDA